MASPFENMQAAVKRSSLLATPDATDSIFLKDIELLHEDPTNPRSPRNKGYDEEALQDFADDIKERGILNPLTITPHPSIEGHFLVIAGHRRLRAARLAGLAKVPAVIRLTNDLKGDQIAENIHRENLDNFEIAAIIKSYLDQGMSTREVSRKLHKSQSYVQIYSKYLSAPDFIKDLADSGQISDMTAVSLLVTCYNKNESLTRRMIELAIAEGKNLSTNFAKHVKNSIEFKEKEAKASALEERYQTYLQNATTIPADEEEHADAFVAEISDEPSFDEVTSETSVESTFVDINKEESLIDRDSLHKVQETVINDDVHEKSFCNSSSEESTIQKNHDSYSMLLPKYVEILVQFEDKTGSLLIGRKPSQDGHVWVKLENEIIDCDCSKLKLLSLQDKRNA